MRYERFPRTGGEPLAASTAPIPWTDGRVTLIGPGPGRVIVYAKTLTEKRRMLIDTDDGDIIFVAWPGRYCQDIFQVDDLNAARRGVGLVPARETRFETSKGEVWQVRT